MIGLNFIQKSSSYYYYSDYFGGKMAEPKTCNFHESLSVFELDLTTWKQRDTWYFNLHTVLKTICRPCYKLLHLLHEYLKTADEQTLSFDEDLSSP